MGPTIIIPFRQRHAHLAKFLQHYRRVLKDPFFVIVEQSLAKPFNRGKLLNIGFLEHEERSDYFLFHDVDMLAQNPVDYSYTPHPTLFATNASQFNWKLPSPTYFGGVVGLSSRDYRLCNGHPNEFWGWGGEDNALYYSVLQAGLKPQHRPHRYFSLPHERSHPTGFDLNRLERARRPRLPEDYLANCKYTILKTHPFADGVKLTVSV